MRGFSLPVVLFVVSLGGALAAGGAFVTRQLAASSRATSTAAGLDGTAEHWLVRSVTAVEPSSLAIPVGATVEIGAEAAGDIVVGRWMTRTDTSVYWLVVEARTASKPLLWRRLGAVAQVRDSMFALVPGRATSDLH